MIVFFLTLILLMIGAGLTGAAAGDTSDELVDTELAELVLFSEDSLGLVMGSGGTGAAGGFLSCWSWRVSVWV